MVFIGQSDNIVSLKQRHLYFIGTLSQWGAWANIYTVIDCVSELSPQETTIPTYGHAGIASCKIWLF